MLDGTVSNVPPLCGWEEGTVELHAMPMTSTAVISNDLGPSSTGSLSSTGHDFGR
jgi:hypothetical protein